MTCPASLTHGSSRVSLLLRTGDHCTQTGWWSPVDHDIARFVTEGSLMPSLEGQAVLWDLAGAQACGSCPAWKCSRTS